MRLRTRPGSDPAPAGDTEGTMPPDLDPDATLAGASGEAEDETASLPLTADGRYEPLQRIGGGGMGQVMRVRDHLLGRVLAMKVIDWRLSDRPASRARFIAEANLAARLQHPNIVPVYDRGELSDGRVWFTMPEVHGRTLAALNEALHAASGGGEWRSTPDGWSMRRLLSAFASAARAVGYAHAQGVIHRDLKPANIMVGAFGEVQVMDWGVAAVLATAALEGPDLREGEVSGTAAFMAPEQAAGRTAEQGPWTDVYALGAILFELLAGPRTAPRARRSALTEVIGPGHPPLPEELIALCAQAMDLDPRRRPPEGVAFADALSAWLDGDRRRDQASALVAGAAPLAEAAGALRAEALALRAAAGAKLAGISPRAPEEEKAPYWEMEEQAVSLERDAALAETRWLQSVRAALEHYAELPAAHRALADHYQRLMAEAEARRDRPAAARYEILLRTHDRGDHRAWLSNQGAVSLDSAPSGAEVLLFRVLPQRRRLVLEPRGSLGRTPIRAAPLEAGSWVLRLVAEGCAAVDVPVLVERGAHWDGLRPGETRPRALGLPRAGELLPSERLIPGGWCWLGGDPDALDPLPRRRWWIDDLVVMKWPVTNDEYLIFLNDVVRQKGVEAALDLAPGEVGTTGTGRHLHVVSDGAGGLQLGPEGRGAPAHPRAPVTWIDHAGATAYAAWLAGRTGQPWRLLHDHEWEKAARGVDGRFYPWGDAYDPTWAANMASHAGPAHKAAVEGWPLDLSPYGVAGLAGNVRDWCLNGYLREGPGAGGLLIVDPTERPEGFVLARGGTYVSTAVHARAANRFAARPGDRLGTLGLRLARPWRGPDSPGPETR